MMGCTTTPTKHLAHVFAGSVCVYLTQVLSGKVYISSVRSALYVPWLLLVTAILFTLLTLRLASVDTKAFALF